MDNLEDKVVRCLNPECGMDSCRNCKLSIHIPLTCKEYEEVIGGSRKRVEEELTMSWVRQCWNCKIDFERVGGCVIMTCPRCGMKTCYACRKKVDEEINHNRCNLFNNNKEKELKESQEKIQSGLNEDEREVLKDIFEAGPSTS